MTRLWLAYEIFAQFDVVAIIAPERRSDVEILPRLAEKFLQDRSLALFVRRAELIILQHNSLAAMRSSCSSLL